MNTTRNISGYLKENSFQSTDMINTTQCHLVVNKGKNEDSA
jgi:hypothetical protein